MMFCRTFSFLLFVVTSVGAQEACSVCGDGKVVTAPNAMFEFPNQPSVPCKILEHAGMNGYIPLDQCVFLPPLLTMCGCAPTE
mmetsp:Transcript_2142/g.3078  ORF Transcript_2142/g.3078 Transcript_2142/m.3078 type:complete len:83 (+) Transcript_2142:920-1168(+)